MIIGIENGTSDTVDLSSLTDADADSTNELQTLSLSNDTLYLSDGNDVYLGNLNGTSGGSSQPGTISYPMANHMFYTPTTGNDGELIVSMVIKLWMAYIILLSFTWSGRVLLI